MRIGRTMLTHGYLMAKKEPPSRSTCGIQLTFKHILTECHRYETRRSENHIPDQLHESLRPQIDAIGR